jgi:archaellum biogenesis protein FlaJ (TadC family)
MNSADWRIGFQKNVPKLIVVGIIIALIGFVFVLIVMNIFPQDEIFPAGRKQTFALNIFGLSGFIFYGGLALVIFGIFMYIITHTTNPSD